MDSPRRFRTGRARAGSEIIRMRQKEVSRIGLSNGDGPGSNGTEIPASKPTAVETHEPPSRPDRDPYRGVVIVLLAGAIAGMVGGFGEGLKLGNPVLIDAALTLALTAGMLIGVAWTQAARLKPPRPEAEAPNPAPEAEGPTPEAQTAPSAIEAIRAKAIARLRVLRASLGRWYPKVEQIGFIRLGTALGGILGISYVSRLDLYVAIPTPSWAWIVAAGCVVAAGLAATAVHYLGSIEPARFPESPALRRGTRVVAWLMLLCAVSIGLAWQGPLTATPWAALGTTLRVLHWALLTFNAAICFGLLRIRRPEDEALRRFPLDLGVLSVFGSRNNILASVLDSAEQQLGIDLRSTWALTVVRRSLEPLAIGLLLAGWLSTSLTVVGTQDQGLIERFGVPVGGDPLEPGLHIHLPWPIDRVYRIPVKRVQSLTVGHEGQEEGGPEDVLWAKEHAPNEYTLLLGNGRDLITVDASVAFRITDARAWRYHSQNPGDALKAIAYRAVMRNTVNRTLTDALSENVAALTSRMRAMVQQEADALGLGVHVEAFTVGGMHPPVAVAAAYQAVISAELGKTTAIVNAQAYRNRTVPDAESFVLRSVNRAGADGAETLAKAAGQAWAFRTLESQFRASPQEYFFRRRLETLESGLAGKKYTVVDSRFQRDGGELWLRQ